MEEVIWVDSNGDLDEYVAFPKWSPDGSKLFYQKMMIFSSFHCLKLVATIPVRSYGHYTQNLISLFLKYDILSMHPYASN